MPDTAGYPRANGAVGRAGEAGAVQLMAGFVGVTRLPDLTPPTGSEVRSVCFDYSVTLSFAGQDQAGEQRIDATMVIGTPFTISSDDAAPSVVPDTGESFAAVLGLLRLTGSGGHRRQRSDAGTNLRQRCDRDSPS